MFYTDEYINENYPEHCRTSCDDVNRYNRDVKGHGCWRCNALEFQSLEILREQKIHTDFLGTRKGERK